MIESYRGLLNFLATLLSGLAEGTGPRRSARFTGLASQVWDCRGFSAVTDLLRQAPYDRHLRRRIERMQEANGKRRWLNGRSEAFLTDWYAMYADDPRVTANIARMVDEIAEAYWSYVNFGIEPSTGRWHDNQCSLWSLTIDQRDREMARQARAEGKGSLHQAAFVERKRREAEMDAHLAPVMAALNNEARSGAPDMTTWDDTMRAFYLLLGGRFAVALS